MNTNIGVLQYIKDKDISIENEISNIKAGRDTHIIVTQLFINSPDFNEINRNIILKKELISRANSLTEKEHFIKELKHFEELQINFQIQVLQMAKAFSKLKFKSKKLKKALNYFNNGFFEKADKVLTESDLSNDQFNLLIKIDYLESKVK